MLILLRFFISFLYIVLVFRQLIIINCNRRLCNKDKSFTISLFIFVILVLYRSFATIFVITLKGALLIKNMTKELCVNDLHGFKGKNEVMSGLHFLDICFLI